MIKNTSKNSIFTFLVFLLILAAIFIFHNKNTAVSQGKMDNYVLINKTPLSIEIADEYAEQWQGLSDREFLDEHAGMLFVFDNYQIRTFVMRRMCFPLDIIWIKDNEVVKIDKNLPPEGEKPENRYQSEQNVNLVLETNGGFADTNDIEVGDKVDIHFAENEN